MYSEGLSTVASDNDNRLACGKCAYVWLDYRGLPPDKLNCPRCKSIVVRKAIARGLVQSGSRRNKQPRSALDDVIEVLEFVEGDGTYQRRSFSNIG